VRAKLDQGKQEENLRRKAGGRNEPAAPAIQSRN